MILETGCPVHLGCLPASLAALQSRPKLAPDDAKCPPKTMALRMEVMLCTQNCLSGSPGCCSPGQGGEAGGQVYPGRDKGPREAREVRKVYTQVRACHRDLCRAGRQLPGLTELGSINCGHGREKCAHLLWDVSLVVLVSLAFSWKLTLCLGLPWWPRW